jgi:two-component system KDP operon response regulator KdpE
MTDTPPAAPHEVLHAPVPDVPPDVPHRPLIAVIEDEAPIRKFLRASLTGEGYRVNEADTAQAGLRSLTQEPPDLILLDLGLPDRDGRELIEEVRGWSDVPVIILSARDQEREKVAALDAGADDYLSKPFGVGELLARIRVALRHRSRAAAAGAGPEATTLTSGPLSIDLAAHRVRLEGREVKLTRLEFELLATLARHADKVLTHRFLLKEVWGPHSVHETHYLRVFVANLRKKLERDPARPRFILTEQGVGYRFADPE